MGETGGYILNCLAFIILGVLAFRIILKHKLSTQSKEQDNLNEELEKIDEELEKIEYKEKQEKKQLASSKERIRENLRHL